MSFFETELLRSAFFRCLQDWNGCGPATGKACGPDDRCGCADEMQAYLDEAREAVSPSSGETP